MLLSPIRRFGFAASGVSGGLEDAVFSFSGVDEEPDFLDEVLDGDAFGYALLAAAGFGSFAVALFAGFAGWFAAVSVAFDCCVGSAGL
jgi:hypothetical protein